MENIARGCFISLQPCLCTRSTHIFSSLSLNQSSLLCIAPPPPPPFVSLFLQFPPLPVLSVSIFENVFSLTLRLQCDKSARMVSLLTPPSSPPPHPHPPTLSLSNPGGPKRTRQRCHFGPALREDEAGKVTEKESERRWRSAVQRR